MKLGKKGIGVMDINVFIIVIMGVSVKMNLFAFWGIMSFLVKSLMLFVVICKSLKGFI